MAGESEQHEQHGDESGPIKEIRDQLKSEQKARKEAEARLEKIEPVYKASVLRDAGFDPESPRASALLKLHEGELEVEALKATASEYGLEPGEGEGGQTPKPELSDEERQAIQSSDRGQQLAAHAAPVESPQTLDARIAEAEKKAEETGNWNEFNQLQAQASLARH